MIRLRLIAFLSVIAALVVIITPSQAQQGNHPTVSMASPILRMQITQDKGKPKLQTTFEVDETEDQYGYVLVGVLFDADSKDPRHGGIEFVTGSNVNLDIGTWRTPACRVINTHGSAQFWVNHRGEGTADVFVAYLPQDTGTAPTQLQVVTSTNNIVRQPVTATQQFVLADPQDENGGYLVLALLSDTSDKTEATSIGEKFDQLKGEGIKYEVTGGPTHVKDELGNILAPRCRIEQIAALTNDKTKIALKHKSDAQADLGLLYFPLEPTAVPTAAATP